MPPPELILYETSDGRCPFAEWLQGLSDRKARAIIKTRLDRLEAYGHRGTCEPVGGGVFELKIFYGPGYRIYFMEEGRQIILLLYGGDKKTQQKDIRKAHEFALDYKNCSARGAK